MLIGKGDLLDDWVSKWQIPFTSIRTDLESRESTVIFKLHSSVPLLNSCFSSFIFLNQSQSIIIQAHSHSSRLLIPPVLFRSIFILWYFKLILLLFSAFYCKITIDLVTKLFSFLTLGIQCGSVNLPIMSSFVCYGWVMYQSIRLVLFTWPRHFKF